MLSSWLLLPCHLTKSWKHDLGKHFTLWIFHQKSMFKGYNTSFQTKWRPKEYRCRAIVCGQIMLQLHQMIVNNQILWVICCAFPKYLDFRCAAVFERKKSSKQNCFMLSSWLVPCHLTEKNSRICWPRSGFEDFLWIFHHKSMFKGSKTQFHIKWRPKEYRYRAIICGQKRMTMLQLHQNNYN